MNAKLLLEDGTVFEGKAFGGEGETSGEVVFHTGMTGYQEILSDPSYCGQMIAMTYPLIGNYGINRDDFEAIRPWVQGFIVRNHELAPSNWRSSMNLNAVLKQYGIPGISGIDTRMLTRIIRQHGTMKGLLSTSSKPLAALQEQLHAMKPLRNQVSLVSTPQPYRSPGAKERIVVVDFGCKLGMLRELSGRGCDVVVVPHDSTADQIRSFNPDGVLLSNGPGDPKDSAHVIPVIRELLGEIPLFGICLGHQLFALACGADTGKLAFGHRGSNHPVKEVATGHCLITSQNHGYTVIDATVASTDLMITHINNNDGTIEGLKHSYHPAFSVQFHPEAAPGPYDSNTLFDQFLDMIHQFQRNRALGNLLESSTGKHKAHTASSEILSHKGAQLVYAEK
ncbi:carbamoyl phosphate synthase small subunit [Paenibacillus radicis (ex Xue et al. 2023)]|uniref:Carbamoyl phosphate synthase small chain n=1 Tax=Paenibacillus radicis (ex Xue et al. 2023) TaxID=2972489 RepID=A0ABT1YPN0_9BACL|nr:carbamoyl phosphate synthase small subunit [Paenibacillus radicis (ex Xue et al. 2023)]MCR8635139.1 carbamoyl phosphate synthase small subunit [Paenibacillus radicis (ex Xue et al. 2023)]